MWLHLEHGVTFGTVCLCSAVCSLLGHNLTHVGFCRCCGLDNAIFSPRKSVNGLPMAAIVCDLCSRHQGSDAHALKKAARLHQEMWHEHERERVEALVECHERTLAARDAKITKLEEELEHRPIHVVEKWVDLEVLHAAHEMATTAYRSRDHALRQLCLLHMKHHEVPNERCSCGRSIAQCDVVGVLEGTTALLRWERRQEERRDQGLTHQLPWEYVKHLGRRADGDDPHEFDPYPHATGI